MALLHDEHLEFKSHKIHILSERFGDFEVWLNTEVMDYDGLRVGCGTSREAAIEDAATTLEKAALALRKVKSWPLLPDDDETAQAASGG